MPLLSPNLSSCPACGHSLRLPEVVRFPAGASGWPSSMPFLAGRLSLRDPDGNTAEHTLGPGKTTLGRNPSNTLPLSDVEVSKEHAQLEVTSAGVVLRDLDSSNGTFVNGRRIKELRLRSGDEITVGNTRIRFHVGSTRAVAAPGVTVVQAGQDLPAVLAHLDQLEQDEFRPAEQISDVAALRADYEKLRLAHEFHRQVGLERDLKSLLDKILKVSFELLGADNGVVFLVDPRTQELVPKAKRHRQSDAEEVVVSETVLSRAAETRQAVLTADAIIDARFSRSQSVVAQGIRSAMAVPMLAKGSLKGVLFIDSRQRANAFSEKDLKILSGIASQGAVALENAEMAQRIEREAIARAELSRFLSPKVAEMVVSGQLELWRQGRLAEVTVLFADIRGFSRISERESPQEMVGMLNRFFSSMAGVVFRNEGNLDKFIGDCVMAMWGPPSPHPDDGARAMAAALQMQEEVRALNAAREGAGKIPIEVGIGINTGQAVVGYMGSLDRHEFTAIGDSVNVASRLCGMAQGGEVLVAEATVKRAGSGFVLEQLPLAQVKGKENAVAAYRLMAQNPLSVSSSPSANSRSRPF